MAQNQNFVLLQENRIKQENTGKRASQISDGKCCYFCIIYQVLSPVIYPLDTVGFLLGFSVNKIKTLRPAETWHGTVHVKTKTNKKTSA